LFRGARLRGRGYTREAFEEIGVLDDLKKALAERALNAQMESSPFG
jgi:hypothetical protein